MGRLFLLRHTRPDIPTGLCYGHRDVPLASNYPAALETIQLHWTRHVRPEAGGLRVYSSPSSRCRRLAEDLAFGPVCVTDALKELNFGTWEGLLWSEIPRGESDPWALDFVELAPPGGESLQQLADRVESFLTTLGREDTLCVTHSGVIRALLCQEREESLARAFDFEVAYGEVFEIKRRRTSSFD